ncbi:MAG: SMI1/KNR4 family protein [Tildeniella nuda ZEHNDER 1965/U140]|nr:SMI1/KNR4 family protein [Tildeniella nuda ZEHNDER 1965/U140]
MLCRSFQPNNNYVALVLSERIVGQVSVDSLQKSCNAVDPHILQSVEKSDFNELVWIGMSSPSTIAGILRQILNHTAKANPILRANLRKGLSRTQIKQITHAFPFRLPREVEELYQWRDGMNVEVHDDFLFHYHYFLPLHKALEEYQMNLTWRVLGDDDPTIIPNLLPLFSFQGEFYGAYCRREKQDKAPIYFVFHDEGIVYDSLTSMLSAILECYEGLF